MLQDVAAVCRMDCVETTTCRLRKMMHGGAPETPAEKEIAGYRDALLSIRDPYMELFIDSSTILKYHGILFQHTEEICGGFFRDIEHPLMEDLPENILAGTSIVIPPKISLELDSVCVAYQNALNHHELDSLILIPMFLTDFFAIAPFNRGNIRMCLLLTQLLLFRAGFVDWKFASIPSLIENSKEEFFAALMCSADNYERRGKSYIPFVAYLLRVILQACRQVEDQITRLKRTNWSKSKRIRMYIQRSNGEITKAEIMKAFPEISQITLERTLHEMLTKGEVEKIGGGRYTKYRKRDDAMIEPCGQLYPNKQQEVAKQMDQLT